MKVIPQKTKIYIIIVVVVTITLFTMWVINRHNNEKMYQEGIAEMFDESMESSYPLLINSAMAFYTRASLFEYNAKEANMYARDIEEFQEIFAQLNRPYSNSPDGQQVNYWIMQYEWFIPSIPYGRLSSGSDLRDKESRAFRKIEYARQSLNNWSEYEPDSLIHICQDVKVALSEAMRDIEKYRKPYQDINAWRNIGHEKSITLHQKYYSRKNWPFTFLNKK